MMTPRERVFTALSGEKADRIPLTTYEGLLPRGETERRLREEGLCLVCRTPMYGASSPNVSTDTRSYSDGRFSYQREVISTPVGEVSQVRRLGGGYGTSLLCEFPIKRPEDYKVIEFLWRDQQYEPAYDNFHSNERRLGSDGVVIGNLGYTPLQHMLILYMGPERFACDMVDYPEAFFGLYETMAERHREQYRISAESPAGFFIYGDNVTSEMVGAERFEKYVAPRYNELADILHAKGKKLGSHLDGKLVALKEQVARTKLDFVEAFAPFPDGDLPIGDARRAWPAKVIWCNYPSAVHLCPDEQIEQNTQDMIRDTAPGDRFIVGVTENIPDQHWQRSLPVISRVLREEGRIA
jgi:uroporphyrinogen-III decarboxylase